MADPFTRPTRLDTDTSPWVERFEGCWFDSQREQVVDDLKELVIRHRYSSRANDKARGTVEWKVEIAMSDQPAVVVAQRYKVSLSSVYNYRNEFRPLLAAA